MPTYCAYSRSVYTSFLSEYSTLHDVFTIKCLNNIGVLCSLRRLKDVLRTKALICLVFTFRDFFGVSFGDELDNVVNGLDREALAEVIRKLTPRLGARLVLKDSHYVLQG
jgi:hypothetical protein